MTNDELVKKYKEVYKKKTGSELSDTEAFKQAMALVTLVGAIYDPLPVKALSKRG